MLEGKKIESREQTYCRLNVSGDAVIVVESSLPCQIYSLLMQLIHQEVEHLTYSEP